MWLFCPRFGDEFVGCEAIQGLETPAVIVRVDEVGEVTLELPIAVVMIALDGGFFDRPVHAFDLTIGPQMLDLGETMLDAVLAAAHIEHVGDVDGRWAIGVTRRERELNAVVGQDGMNFERNSFDQHHQEGGRRCSAGSSTQAVRKQICWSGQSRHTGTACLLPSGLRQCRCGSSRADRH